MANVRSLGNEAVAQKKTKVIVSVKLDDWVKGVWVRWPGGHVTESDVPANAPAIVVRPNGGVSVE